MAQDSLFGKVIPIDIEKEVKKSFLEYSMSVIVSRALPDVRDGLKPVHRRILYALHEQGMTHDKPHKKSANIVGEVMGKYHPHGDSAIYQTMVKLAQKFAMRYPLVDGHGNFGSIDGDAAAAMRYTESRMARIAAELLKDIDKDTVDWRANYDDSREEPQVLPARIPNLLINGSAGIAVGMATNIPPHNLREVITGIKEYIDNPEITIDELMLSIPGPDFPTGGILAARGIRQAYETGRATIRTRARYEIEEKRGGKCAIVVNEIPYQVNKARLVEKIAGLVRDKKVEGIVDLRDESDRKGIRIVIELRKDVNVNVVLNKLFRHTQMEDSFGIIMLSLVNGEPRILNLKEMIQYYVQHRQEVIKRRTAYELKLARNRKHILEGLKIALDNLDEIIELIRNSRDRETARGGLQSRFGLSEIQANAILDMRLAQLTGLERSKVENEYEEVLLKIADFEDILARPERVLAIIKEDLDEIEKRYGDKRRTEISQEENTYAEEDFIEDHEVVITLSNRGYVKRQPLDTYRSQKRGGKGVSATTIRAEDFANDVLVTSALATLLFFTNQGRVFTTRAFQIPESSRQAKGMPLVNFLELRPGEKVSTIVGARDFNVDHRLLMVTRKGIIKKTALKAFENVRRTGMIAVNLREGDELVGVIRVKTGSKVMIANSRGISIMFDEKQVRTMGRTAAGVKAIRLAKDDYVVGLDRYREDADVLLVTEKGYGKRTALSEFRLQNRGGKGLKAIEITRKNGKLVAFKIVSKEDELVILTSEGNIIRLEVDDISQQKRYSRGVLLMRLPEEDRIVGVARFRIEKEED
ncbi:MAG: DNA gyrase subunit A [Syntrophomonas sp.]|uniref:DNA gyrase subunit A n=1 Tax=Syntrophomonas sp. TaxID=2053627 RepID=UPI00261CC251|nr:DNA gyrase subunit A [Syntrophomonas sp.]MDD2510002.1 DNA gyrase subunit A [Syntrophomonas sp.]MDD3878964.1 DNA gyrase subunit A [Syntrophomonas sp.]MDD4626121.1 DNA gyrase subunit A [Syntrophomonas sp.]